MAFDIHSKTGNVYTCALQGQTCEITWITAAQIAAKEPSAYFSSLEPAGDARATVTANQGWRSAAIPPEDQEEIAAELTMITRPAPVVLRTTARNCGTIDRYAEGAVPYDPPQNGREVPKLEQSLQRQGWTLLPSHAGGGAGVQSLWTHGQFGGIVSCSGDSRRKRYTLAVYRTSGAAPDVTALESWYAMQARREWIEAGALVIKDCMIG